ncbi:hypothetical protein [Nocardioides jiangxiensis]|uniref:Uncharacterized protein n=1 Tax=Nocardioides jiangxiensis TaxID=3064524 RepID=A0ABT9B041_9ACTN|nr:hypothetical protein [Nocardioides sp. WY-20]MDO7868179.1 hypothetical protein [Nocardioides sp. WY-20]
MSDVPDVPEGKSKKRTAIEVAGEGALGAIPFVGSLLAATLSTYFSATQENRTREWMEEMAEVVQALLDRIENLEAEDLADNPAFYDAAVAAARIATSTSAAAKHAALQNALYNVGSGDGWDADKRAIFLRYVDELTPSHISLLRLVEDPPRWFERHGLSWPGGGLLSVVKAAFPAWANDEDFIDTLAADLAARGLVDALPLRAMMTDSGARAGRAKAKGREFIGFISGPFNADGCQ